MPCHPRSRSRSGHFQSYGSRVSIRQSDHEHREHQFTSVYDHLFPQLKRYFDLAKEKGKEKGASSWLSVLPCHWMIMAFLSTRALSGMQYACTMAGIRQIPLPNATVAPSHAMICFMGGFPTIRPYELHDMTASLLSEVCHSVATELRLQLVNGESMTHHTTITTDDARLDIRAREFWSAAQDAYFFYKVVCSGKGAWARMPLVATPI